MNDATLLLIDLSDFAFDGYAKNYKKEQEETTVDIRKYEWYIDCVEQLRNNRGEEMSI